MYQKFVHESVVLRRILCACLVLIMALSMLPMAAPRAAAAMDGQTLYFKPNGGSGDTAWYFAHFFNDGGGETDVRMTENSDGNHYCTVPNGYAKVVIVRMNPDYSAPSWDNGNGFWNKTNDLTLPTDGKNCYEATGWSGTIMTGNWTKIADTSTPTQPSTPSTNVTAYLAGSWTSWATNKIEMTGTDGKNASVTVELAAGRYEFKIIYDNTWYTNTGEISDATGSGGWDMYQNEKNCVLNASGGSYTFTFNIDTKKLVVTYSSSGSGGTGGSTGTVVDLNTGTFPDDQNRLYVNSTFYDYYSDYELDGNNLDNREWYYQSESNWYIFRKFNSALSKYYSDAKARVPIYLGHFQPNWGDWTLQYEAFANNANYNNIGKVYGFMDGNAYGSNGNKDQKWFMSVNNSNLNLKPETGNVYRAALGIVGNELVNGDLLDAGGSIQPLFNADFLQGENLLNKKLADIYTDVQFPFKKDDRGNGIMYWVFDSLNTTLEMKLDKSEDLYYLDEVNKDDRYKNLNSNNSDHPDGNMKAEYGFFPFNEGSTAKNTNTYNYGFGTRIEIPFNLTADGKVADSFGNKQDIIFSFSGDDDVWVFIDNVLVLDIGGSHGRVEGEINFGEMEATVYGVKTSGGTNDLENTDNHYLDVYTTDFTLPKGMTEEHTLTMFYMERGMWESNMKIEFNFIPRSSLWAETTSFTALKQWNIAMNGEIPNDITVQLQQRPAGTTNWTEYETVTINKPSTSAQATKPVWEYKWDSLPNFTDGNDPVLYEYRVVELDNNNNVLDNGANVSDDMIVAYGDVTGNGGSGYTQIISNNQVANNIVVVIDYGLSVDVTVVDEGNGTLVGVGNTLTLPVGPSNELHKDVGDRFVTNHGVVTKNGNKIRYTPSNMTMDAAENIGFCLKLNDSAYTYTYSTLTVIPAANIYYEDGFLSFTDTKAQGTSYGKWEVEGTTSNKTQAEDRPGELTSYDANNVYGYDEAYDNFTLYSLGSARKVTVDEASGKRSTAPTATFTFTGTGFDVVSLTDSTSGAINVEVKKNGTTVVNYIVNNYYGMVYNETTKSWEVADENDNFCLYQVPVIKVENLDYGTYDVTIKAAYLPFMDMENKGHYTIWVDAIRIYNPALNDKTSNDAYTQDGESNPHLTTIKKLLVTPNDFNADADDKEVNGVVYIEGKSTGVTIEEYENEGPNNETYLKTGNAIAFRLKYTGSAKPTADTLGLQVGAKLAVGSSAKLNIYYTTEIDNNTLPTVEKTITTATNMFYKLPTINWSGDSGNYLSDPIVIKCTDAGTGILSLTDLKLTGDFADEVKTASSGEPAAASADNNAEILAVVDMGVYDFAVKVMSSTSDVEEPTEPETTEPEVTEPEITEPETTEPETTEPETTEPEVTEPEVIEPEVTEPETTEPEVTEPEVTEPEAPTQKPEKDPSNAQTGDFSGQNMPMFAMAAFISLLAIIVMTAYTVKNRKVEE